MLFRAEPRVRLSDASEHLGVAHSTAHRLMAMLAYHGFVRQEPDSRAYVAGPALVEIGLAAVRQLDIRRHARPVLESLASSLGETVHLAVLEGGNVRYLDAVESSRALRVAARTGSALAANCTASGKALLAALPDQEVSALFAGQKSLTALTARAPHHGQVPAAGGADGSPRARLRDQPGGERGGRRIGRGRRARPAAGAGRRAGRIRAGFPDDRSGGREGRGRNCRTGPSGSKPSWRARADRTGWWRSARLRSAIPPPCLRSSGPRALTGLISRCYGQHRCQGR